MRIYVGNLNYNTTEEQLSTLFSQHGEVESTSLITDKYSGRSKGFAFVEMPDAEAAKAAINALNGNDVDSRTLNVNEAKPRADRSGGGGGGGGGYGGPRY